MINGQILAMDNSCEDTVVRAWIPDISAEPPIPG
jgi:hypothetical protein